jgi:hypothetical protein
MNDDLSDGMDTCRGIASAIGFLLILAFVCMWLFIAWKVFTG